MHRKRSAPRAGVTNTCLSTGGSRTSQIWASACLSDRDRTSARSQTAKRALRFNAQLDESTALQPYVDTLSRTPRSRAKHHGREVEVMPFKSHPSSLCAAMVADTRERHLAQRMFYPCDFDFVFSLQFTTVPTWLTSKTRFSKSSPAPELF
jgi:hypothetical protein